MMPPDSRAWLRAALQDYSGAELTELMAFCRSRELLLAAACDGVEEYTRARLKTGAT